MNILFDHQVFAEQRWGGVSRYFSKLASELGKSNTVVVHAPLYVSEYLDGKHYKVFGQKIPPFRGATYVGKAVGTLLPAPGDYDIYHSTWYGKGCRGNFKRVVHTVHDLISELYPNDVVNAELQSQRKKIAIEQADTVICVSENTRQDLQRIYGIPEDRVFVTPLATSLNELRSDNFDIGCPFILHVGSRQGYKNFRTLLEAFSNSSLLKKEYALVCFGGKPFDRNERDQLRGLPQTGPGSVVHITGSDRLLAGAYRAADLFVCPSLYEGFGFPVLEAMSIGCPTIAFRSGSIPEVAGNAAYFPTEVSADALRYSIESVLLDSNLRLEMIQAGRHRAELFSWQRTAELTLQAYSS